MTIKETRVKRWDAFLLKEEESKLHAQKFTVEMLLSKNKVLIEKFLDITERKVSIIDDYGDENWDALDEQVEIIFRKIAKVMRINHNDLNKKITISKNKKYLESRIPSKQEIMQKAFSTLRSELKKMFKIHHNKTKHSSKKNTVNYDNLSGVDFEISIANLFKQNGFNDIIGTPTTGDQGADLVVKISNRKIIIQAKRYGKNVGNGAVQEVIGALKYYDGDEGWVITNSRFTSSAKALANKSKIRLVDGDDLKNFPLFLKKLELEKFMIGEIEPVHL